MTHQPARVVACPGVKSQALGGDTCARNLPKSFHTPCQPGNSHLRAPFSIASLKIFSHTLITADFTNPIMCQELISSINRSCKHEQGPVEPAQSPTPIQSGEREMHSLILLWRPDSSGSTARPSMPRQSPEPLFVQKHSQLQT